MAADGPGDGLIETRQGQGQGQGYRLHCEPTLAPGCRCCYCCCHYVWFCAMEDKALSCGKGCGRALVHEENDFIPQPRWLCFMENDSQAELVDWESLKGLLLPSTSR